MKHIGHILKKALFLAAITLGTGMAYSQALTVKGTVVDENDEPLIGVSVMLNGKAIGVTDYNGNYSVSLSAPSTLTFSYIGMETQKVKVSQTGTTNVTLHASSTMLDDVVVVGYGTQRKINLTGAVQSIDGSELTKRSLSSISNALQGAVPGLTAIQSSGQPGADNASLTIRGKGSLNSSTSPLVLIDGLEGDMNRIDLSTVESISVPKRCRIRLHLWFKGIQRCNPYHNQTRKQRKIKNPL